MNRLIRIGALLAVVISLAIVTESQACWRNRRFTTVNCQCCETFLVGYVDSPNPCIQQNCTCYCQYPDGSWQQCANCPDGNCDNSCHVMCNPNQHPAYTPSGYCPCHCVTRDPMNYSRNRKWMMVCDKLTCRFRFARPWDNLADVKLCTLNCLGRKCPPFLCP